MIPISVCIITKNEEQHIGKCLAPLVPYGFEIIVVDTGSTDSTKEIALQYTDLVYDFEWINDFSAARNFSLKKASHNYVLILDSDEFLIDLDIDALYQEIEQHPRSVGMLLRNNYYDAQGKTYNSPDRVERLFHKRYYEYRSTIHEQVTEIKTNGTYYERYNIPLTVDHMGYIGGRAAMLKKVERNNTLLLKEIEKHPTEPYFYFQVGQSYNSIDDYENAYLYYKKAFEFPISDDQPWLPMIASAFMNAMTKTGRHAEALAFFEPRYERFAREASFLTNMGLVYLNNNQPLKAMMEFIKATKCPYTEVEGSNTFIAYYNMGLVNEMLGKLPTAIEFYQTSAGYGYPLAINRLQELRVPMNRTE
ncbi:MAG: glycosyltransferase family 2 protein [Blautia sp.]|nr:glycosyltransferase family 2 protein [Lachnoclostridium sp.]MCM1210208.1 glycosyltransferase family 2 protein [Blautia sp.]